MSTRLQDSFTGTDNTALSAHTMDVGPGWTSTLGFDCTFIHSNKAVPDPSIFSSIGYVSDAGVSDIVLTDVWGVPNASDYLIGVCVRAVDHNNAWIVRLIRSGGGTPTINLYSRTGGSFTLIDSANAPSATNSTVTITVTASGTSILAQLSTGESVSTTSSVRQTATLHGLYDYTDDTVVGGTHDNFLVVDAVTVPTAPSNLAGTAASTSQIDLTWDDNSSDETDFSVDYKQADSGTDFTGATTTTAAADATSKSITGLTEGKRYIFRIKATGAGGDSAYSSTVAVFTKPTAPTINSVSATSEQIAFDVTKNSTAANKIQFQYVLHGAGFGSPIETITVDYDGSSDIDAAPSADLTQDAEYDIRFRNAVDTDAYSDWTATESFTVNTAPTTPVNVVLSVSPFSGGFTIRRPKIFIDGENTDRPTSGVSHGSGSGYGYGY